MYRQRIIHIPVSDKGPQLRAALEEHSKASNAEGGRYSVSQKVYSSENAFINMVTYENLAALDAYNAKPMDDARRGRIAKIGEFSERRWAELEEVLVAPQPNGDFNYVLRVIYTPAVGKGGRVAQDPSGTRQHQISILGQRRCGSGKFGGRRFILSRGERSLPEPGRFRGVPQRESD